MSTNNYLLLGASRGLGASFSQILLDNCESQIIVSRTKPLVTSIRHYSLDLSKSNNLGQLLDIIKIKHITHIIYFAGGGPFGSFGSKEFKDHMWAFNLNLLFPTQLLHSLLKNKINIKQCALVGSAIAEDKGDKHAASYAGAKHGLRGLFDSLLLEDVAFDLRMFSPGYMDTNLLPKNAKIKLTQKLRSPEECATVMFNWLRDSKAAKHKIFL